MSTILVVDDIATMRNQYAFDLKRLGNHRVLTAEGGEEALEILEKGEVECMILDLEMPGMNGFEVLRRMKKRGYAVPVIVYTGTGDYDRCVEAVRLGATSFIDKSETMIKVAQEIENALERSQLKTEVEDLRTRLDEESRLVGESAAMEKLREEIERVAPVPSSVLVLGESGTGKDLVAREIHRLSGRSEPFFAINCAAIPENLVESELFGHEAGSFTGADRTRKGAFETADKGTLFLDEIGELPLGVQSKLLRVLEDGRVTRVGGTKTVRVDTRVIAATNRNLDEAVEEKQFRQDLLFRINVHQIHVPPLRERGSDIELLVGYFLPRTCKKLGMPEKEISPEALDLLTAYSWRRNNVRELKNVVERMIIASDGGTVTKASVPTEILTGKGKKTLISANGSFKELKAEAEKEIILAALNENDWHITNTAKQLGLADHSSLLRIMKRHDIKQ